METPKHIFPKMTYLWYNGFDAGMDRLHALFAPVTARSCDAFVLTACSVMIRDFRKGLPTLLEYGNARDFELTCSAIWSRLIESHGRRGLVI
jgi:hypothetical protein